MADQFPILILMAALGLSAGNFATTFIYRLPRHLPIAKSPPYCECERKVTLKVRDNFPLFSWLINRGTCRFCPIRIPALYPFVEVSCGIFFTAAWLKYGMQEQLVLVLLLGVLAIMQAAILYTHERLIPAVSLSLTAISAIWRTLQDGTIFQWVENGFWGMLIGLAFWALETRIRKRPDLPKTDALVLAMACVGIGLQAVPALLIVSAVASVLFYLCAFREDNACRHRASWLGLSAGLVFMLIVSSGDLYRFFWSVFIS